MLKPATRGAFVVDDPFVRLDDAAGLRRLSDHLADRLLTPKNESAEADGTTDDSAAFAAIKATAAASLNSDTEQYQGSMDLAGRRYRADSSIDLSGLSAGSGVSFGNGSLVSHATGKTVLDCVASRDLHIHDLNIWGDATDTPAVGIGFAPSSGGATSPRHSMTHNNIRGTFSLAGVVNQSSEVSDWRAITVMNDYRSEDAYGVIWQGNPIHTLPSDYQTVFASGFSNTRHRAQSIRVHRTKTTGITVTGITQANPAVVSYTGTQIEAGFDIVIDSVAGMTELNGRVFTPANITSSSFELSGENSSAYGAWTSGGTVHYKTGPCFYIGQLHSGRFDLYGAQYGSYTLILENDPDVTPAALDLANVVLDLHGEGNAVQSLVRFKTGTNIYRARDVMITEPNSHSVGSVFSTDANGGGKVILENCDITVQRFIETPANGLFDNPSLYQFSAGGILRIGSESVIANQIGALLRPPDTVLVPGETWPLRRYNGLPSPAHNQVLGNFNELITPVSSSAAKVYNSPWLDRVGSSSGPTISTNENNFVGGLSLILTTGTDYSDLGLHRRGPQRFRPDRGEMLLEFHTLFSASGDIDDQVTAIGWDGSPTSAALADTDMLCTLGALVSPTVNATDACGIVHDDQATGNWYAFQRKASGTATATSLGVGPVAGTASWWRLFVNTDGDLLVFRSTDNLTWALLATIENAITASSNYAPTIARKATNLNTSSHLRMQYMHAMCLK